MKKITLIAAFAFATSFAACAQKKEKLTPEEFHTVIAKDITSQIIDVRTPEEFSKGHIPRAKNLEIQKDKEEFYAQLDKSKPVYVYCLVGGRSAAAAEKLKEKGFEVYELDKGINAWRAAEMPEIKTVTKAGKGLSREDYQKLISSDLPVLVDFYAKWCGPCVKMKPYFDELAQELKGQIDIVRIDIDENSALAAQLKATALPTLKLYKDGKEVWNHSGYIAKEDIKKAVTQ